MAKTFRKTSNEKNENGSRLPLRSVCCDGCGEVNDLREYSHGVYCPECVEELEECIGKRSKK